MDDLGLPLFLETPKNQYTKLKRHLQMTWMEASFSKLAPWELKILKFVLRTKDALEENTQDLCEGNEGSIYIYIYILLI